MKTKIKYCPYCGSKLRHVVETDISTPLACKLCKQFSINELVKELPQVNEYIKQLKKGE